MNVQVRNVAPRTSSYDELVIGSLEFLSPDLFQGQTQCDCTGHPAPTERFQHQHQDQDEILRKDARKQSLAFNVISTTNPDKLARVVDGLVQRDIFHSAFRIAHIQQGYIEAIASSGAASSCMHAREGGPQTPLSRACLGPGLISSTTSNSSQSCLCLQLGRITLTLPQKSNKVNCQAAEYQKRIGQHQGCEPRRFQIC